MGTNYLNFNNHNNSGCGTAALMIFLPGLLMTFAQDFLPYLVASKFKLAIIFIVSLVLEYAIILFRKKEVENLILDILFGFIKLVTFIFGILTIIACVYSILLLIGVQAYQFTFFKSMIILIAISFISAIMVLILKKVIAKILIVQFREE